MAMLMNFKNHILSNNKEYMTLDFGKQTLRGSAYNHKGIDVIGYTKISSGYDYVLAFDDGVVVDCKNNFAGQNTKTDINGCGNYVIIKHSNGYVTRYMHLTKYSVTVSKGDTVTKGQIIGYMGETGNVTGRHLHFDISHNNKYVDPKPYLYGTYSFFTKTFKVKYKDGLNIRMYPNTKSSVLGEYKYGEIFTVIQLSGNWGRTLNGWVNLGKTFVTELF